MTPGGFYDFEETRRLTGIEASRLRFMETEFCDLLHRLPGAVHDASYATIEVGLLTSIHDMLFKEGLSPEAVRQRLEQTGRGAKVIAVTSGKGGVGKTTVATNLAITLQAMGRQTLLVDADLGMANAHVFAGVDSRVTLLDFVDGRVGIEEAVCHGPGGIRLLCGVSGNARAASLDARSLETLCRGITRLSAGYDVTLIDTGAGIADQVTRFLALAGEIVVVTTPNIAATLDAYGVIKVSRTAGLRARIGLLVNQAQYEADADAVYGKISQCSDRFLKYKPRLLGWLPRSTALEDGNQARRPLSLEQPMHPEARRLRKIAERLLERTPESGTQKQTFAALGAA